MDLVLPMPVPQAGVIPYRREQHDLDVLLITSRRRGRWIIPKGWVDRRLDPARSALQEAYEEAGVRGMLSRAALGWYQYRKQHMRRTVVVFALEVQVVLERWPEMDERERRWFPLSVAAELVRGSELRRLIATLPQRTQ